MILDGVSMRFGNFDALSNVSFGIEGGEILGVAGPNGAGKSTLMNVCTGGLTATSGRVMHNDTDITRLRRHHRCGRGIAQTFQSPMLITSLTVGENLLAGQVFGTQARGTPPILSIEEVTDLVGLGDMLDRRANDVDLLTRKRIMLGAALATGPGIIFMDEPLAGLNTAEIDQILNMVRTLNNRLNITIVMVEHKTRALAEIASRILIINFGKLVMLDRPEVVLNDDHIVDIYLGRKHDA